MLGALNEVIFVKHQMQCLALQNVLAFSNPLEAQELVCHGMATSLPCLERHEAAAATWTSWELSAITRLSDTCLPLPMRYAHTHPPRVCPKISVCLTLKQIQENTNMQDGEIKAGSFML